MITKDPFLHIIIILSFVKSGSYAVQLYSHETPGHMLNGLKILIYRINLFLSF